MMIKLSTRILTIITSEMGKMHENALPHITIKIIDLILDTHSTEYIWQVFDMSSAHR